MKFKLWQIMLVIMGAAVLLAVYLSQVSAGDKAFPASEFSKVKPLLCAPDAGAACQASGFTIRETDLNGDGKAEWMFYGPSEECGVHGNCPVRILAGDGSAWRDVSAPCTDSACLQWGNALFSQILKTAHLGYRDLLISSDSGSFYWVKETYRWDGKNYRLQPKGTSYYYYDSDHDRLKEVGKSRWDRCMKEGKGCA